MEILLLGLFIRLGALSTMLLLCTLPLNLSFTKVTFYLPNSSSLVSLVHHYHLPLNSVASCVGVNVKLRRSESKGPFQKSFFEGAHEVKIRGEDDKASAIGLMG